MCFSLSLNVWNEFPNIFSFAYRFGPNPIAFLFYNIVPKRNSEHFYILQNGSERNDRILSVFLFYQMVRKWISSIFIFWRIVCNERTKFLVFSSSTIWFRTEFQAFFLSSAKLFWTKLRNSECCSLLGNGSERNSELFYLPRNGSERNS
jgi:hypothetical protein